MLRTQCGAMILWMNVCKISFDICFCFLVRLNQQLHCSHYIVIQYFHLGLVHANQIFGYCENWYWVSSKLLVFGNWVQNRYLRSKLGQKNAKWMVINWVSEITVKKWIGQKTDEPFFITRKTTAESLLLLRCCHLPYSQRFDHKIDHRLIFCYIVNLCFCFAFIPAG